MEKGTGMDILQLKEFKSLAGTLSYSETAYRLHVSTSTLSRHIQQLEEELGGKLFDRTTRAISMTELGRVFLPHAVMILQEYEDGMISVRKYNEKLSHTFVCGTIYSIEEYDIDHYFAAFREEYPDYSPVIHIGTMADLERGFKEGKFNSYSAVFDESIEDLQFFKMGDILIKAVMPASSDLARKAAADPSHEVKLRDLSSVPLLMPEEGSTYFSRTMGALEKAVRNPNIVYKGRYEDSINLIKNGMGVALFPFKKSHKIHGSDPDLVYYDTDPGILFEYGIGYRKRHSPAEAVFIDFLYKKSRDPEFLRKLNHD